MFRTHPDSSLSYVSAGAGPLVVLCHGVTDSAAALSDLVGRLADRYLVVAIDGLGHGLSRTSTATEREAPMASALAALADTLDLLVHEHGRAVGIGHSMGGALLTRLAVQRPDLFAGVIGEDPSWLSPSHAQRYVAGIPATLAHHRAIRSAPAGTLEHNQAEHPAWPEAERAGWLAANLQVDLDFLATGEVGDTDWRDVATKLSVPTLIVSGDGADVVLGQSGLHEIDQLRNANIATHMVAGASHCVRRDDAEAFQTVVNDFLSRVHPPLDPDAAVRLPGEPAVVGPQPSQTTQFYIDPQLQRALTEPYFPHWDPVGTRERADANARPAIIAPGTALDVVEVDGQTVRVWHPPTTPERVIFAIHGGGFMAGRPAYDDERNSELAAQLNAVVASPEYRLAPEHPFPAGARDCMVAAQWIETTFDLPLYVYGDSAGGGLAETTAAMLLERGSTPPAGVIMLEPFLDPSMSGRSIRTQQDAQMWNRRKAYHAWRAYLADTHPRELPRLIDHAHGNFLPRVLTVVASADLLRDEGIVWTTDLVDAGFNAQLHMMPGTYHAGLSVPGTRVWKRVLALIENFVTERD